MALWERGPTQPSPMGHVCLWALSSLLKLHHLLRGHTAVGGWGGWNANPSPCCFLLPHPPPGAEGQGKAKSFHSTHDCGANCEPRPRPAALMARVEGGQDEIRDAS